MVKHIVTLDWLQVQGVVPAGFNAETKVVGYRIKAAEHGTKQWECLAEVAIQRELLASMADPWFTPVSESSDYVPFGTITWRPRNASWDRMLCIFKLDNELLYTGRAADFLAHFFINAGIKYRGISRVDIACDFHKFAYGLLPQSLINGYLGGQYLKVGLRDAWGYIKGSDKGHQRAVVESLTYGKAGQALQCILYNKSRELAVSGKSYISEWWRLNGLIPDAADVWRVEFRVRPKGLEAVNVANGMPVHYSISDLVASEQIQALFQSLADKYFRFHEFRGCSKVQNNPLLPLFGFDEPSIWRPKREDKKPDASKYLKGVAGFLDKLQAACDESGDSSTAATLKQARAFLMRTYDFGQQAKEASVKDAFRNGRFGRPGSSVHNFGQVYAGLNPAGAAAVIAAQDAWVQRMNAFAADAAYVNWDAIAATTHAKRVVESFTNPHNCLIYD